MTTSNAPPQKRGDETQRRILEAATLEFSDKGFSGARMDEIAKRAGANKATIYYHIGDKSALYATVLHGVFSNVADQMAERIQQAATPTAKLEQYVRTIAENMERNPWVPAIMLREMASGGANWPDRVARIFARIFELLSGVLKEGIAAGIFREVSPLMVHFSVLGPLMMLKRMEPKIRYFSEEAGVLPDVVRFPDNLAESVAEHVVSAVVKK